VAVVRHLVLLEKNPVNLETEFKTRQYVVWQVHRESLRVELIEE